ncbi:hypothetical protein MK786_07395 [Microbacterium sp. CFH 31415]|uniref:hypothetical protein n=1 Tax=Microbacterium sp. CFH 31415 TaxID=2921732 RepID=UPI001F146ABA|nr:hypothetical protein [Microbacterium sp. CFH 31415]MCH6230559.1 hypothetical protein [Microbacterium sp. CFH 31415]
MAWSYAYPGASQGSDNPVNYYTWRNLKGTVQFRFIDIAIDGGARWYIAAGTINLIDNNGKVWSDKWVNKEWGVTPAFTGLCFIPGGALCRMQVTMHVYNSNGYPLFNTWKSELRWDNSTAS